MLKADLANILELDDLYCVSLVCRLVLGEHDLARSTGTELPQHNVLVELVGETLASQNELHTPQLAQLALEEKKASCVVGYIKLERVVNGRFSSG